MNRFVFWMFEINWDKIKKREKRAKERKESVMTRKDLINYLKDKEKWH